MRHSESVIAAFKAIDRKDFVGSNNLEEAYEDYALYIGHNATISQPTTVAFMLEKLGAVPGDIVLDIGAGSGWTTALLAAIVGEYGRVYGVEIIPELVEFGQHNLGKYNFPHATIEQATEQLGLSDRAPFDRILVSAAANSLSSELVEQLRVGGSLIIPIKSAIWKVNKSLTSEIAIVKYPGFAFVPLQ
ncbi:MAG: hypothetical protein BGO68_06275 [Candidatus Amoebophilus sp. 36-38]|nr:MAG: hypothetical protein BGO68_06275 [Candidatus Amoebophilus sp. 36-38]